MGRIGEARRDAERALELSKDIARAGTPSADLGAAYLALGRALRADGEPEAARAAFGAAHEQLGPTLGPDHPDRGDELGAVHRAAVRMGTVLTGAAAGVIPAVILINADAASWLGTDEAIFVGSLLAGAGAGVLVQLALDSKLRPGATVRSGMRLLPSGAPAVVVSIAY